MASINHENTPHYLRTKLDPEVEQRFEAAVNKATGAPDAAQKAEKQLQNLNKVANALIEQFQAAQNDWDSKTGRIFSFFFFFQKKILSKSVTPYYSFSLPQVHSLKIARTKLPPTSDPADTTTLFSAITTGKGLATTHLPPQPGAKFPGFPGGPANQLGPRWGVV